MTEYVPFHISKFTNTIQKKMYIVSITNQVKKDSKYEQEYTYYTFKNLHPEYQIEYVKYTEDDFIKLPDVVSVLKELVSGGKPTDLNTLVDSYRYRYIYKHGGMTCLSNCYWVRRIPDDILNNRTFVYTKYNNKHESVINTCLFGAVQNCKDPIDKFNRLYPPSSKIFPSYEYCKYMFDNNQLGCRLLNDFILEEKKNECCKPYLIEF